MRSLTRVLAFALLVLTSKAWAGLSVFTCEPEWASLVTEIGGEHVDVYSATTAFQDPHYIQARPSLISKVRRADLVVCTGAELEQGWLPVLLSRSGNSRVQPGRDGMLFMAEQVELRGQPVELDRGHGHLHADGNPHIHADPGMMLQLAVVLSDRLQKIDPDNAASYRSAHEGFADKLNAAIPEWESKAASLKGTRLISHHQYWRYLVDWLGIEVIANLEPKAGVQPTIAHLSSLKNTDAKDASMIIRVSYSEARGAEWLASETRLPVKVLPATVDHQGGQSLMQWYENLIEILLQ